MKRNILYIILNSTSLGIAVLVISGIAALMVGSVLVPGLVMLKLEKYIPDCLVWSLLFILFGVMLAGGIILAWKHGWHKLVQEDKKSRGQSFLLWETPAFLFFLLLFVISWRTDLNWPLAVGLCLPVVALVLALAIPFPRCRNGFWSAVRGLGFASALGVFLLGGLILGRTGKEVSYRGNDPAAFPSAVQWIGTIYVPAGASDIRLEGRSTACRWSCRVSEKDFQKFRAQCSFEFTLVEKPRDMLDKGPFPYWIYENRRRDGGGVTLRYDVGSQTMTGLYSHH